MVTVVYKVDILYTYNEYSNIDKCVILRLTGDMTDFLPGYVISIIRLMSAVAYSSN